MFLRRHKKSRKSRRLEDNLTVEELAWLWEKEQIRRNGDWMQAQALHDRLLYGDPRYIGGRGLDHRPWGDPRYGYPGCGSLRGFRVGLMPNPYEDQGYTPPVTEPDPVPDKPSVSGSHPLQPEERPQTPREKSVSSKHSEDSPRSKIKSPLGKITRSEHLDQSLSSKSQSRTKRSTTWCPSEHRDEPHEKGTIKPISPHHENASLPVDPRSGFVDPGRSRSGSGLTSPGPSQYQTQRVVGDMGRTVTEGMALESRFRGMTLQSQPDRSENRGIGDMERTMMEGFTSRRRFGR